jgi:hypothetical protein
VKAEESDCCWQLRLAEEMEAEKHAKVRYEVRYMKRKKEKRVYVIARIEKGSLYLEVNEQQHVACMLGGR